MDWDALFSRNLKPPLVPILKSATDVGNFDKEFTSQKPVLTPPGDALPLSVEEQARFKDFDFLSQHFLNVWMWAWSLPCCSRSSPLSCCSREALTDHGLGEPTFPSTIFFFYIFFQAKILILWIWPQEASRSTSISFPLILNCWGRGQFIEILRWIVVSLEKKWWLLEGW